MELSDKLAFSSRTGLNSAMFARLLETTQIEPRSKQRSRSEFLIGVLEAIDMDELKQQRILQFASLVSHSPAHGRMVHKLERLNGK